MDVRPATEAPVAESVRSRNLRFLREHASQASWEAVRNAGEGEAEWRLDVVPDRAGNPQFRPLGKDGHLPPLHSPRDPYGEAQRQVERWFEANPLAPGRIVVVFGAAAAFHLHALADRLGETNALLVVDVNPRVVADALEHADFASLAATRAKMVRFVVGHEEERVLSEFYQTLAQWPRLDYSFFIHPGTQRAFAQIYNPMAYRFAEKVRVDMIHRTTMVNLTRGWLENAIRNLPDVLDATPLQALAGRFAGIPAAVVAAGPTLAECLPLLRALRGKALFIAVGTSYRPLRAAGIDPHLTVLVDGSPVIARQFEDVATDAGRLLLPPQIHPSVVAKFRSRLVCWQSGALPEFRDWLEQFAGYSMDALGAGGTVTYSAIDAARYLGCPEIYAFGLDLAFADDGQTHVGNSMYTGRRLPREGLVPVRGNVRERVWTIPQFATYIELLAELAAKIAADPACALVNVNPDGARIPGMVHCLPSAIDPDRFAPVPSVDALLDGLCGGSAAPAGALARVLGAAKADLRVLGRAARRAASLCRDLAASGPDGIQAQRHLRRLGGFEAKLGAASPGGLLLSAAVRANSMETIAFCAGIGESDEEGFARVHEKCAEYYEQLDAMVQWLRDELDNVPEEEQPAG